MFPSVGSLFFIQWNGINPVCTSPPRISIKYRIPIKCPFGNDVLGNKKSKRDKKHCFQRTTKGLEVDGFILVHMTSVKHLGLLQFKKEISENRIETCFLELESLAGAIPGLLDITHGPYIGTEGLNENFSHGFIMTFADAASLEAYLPHPEHERVKGIVLPCIEKSLVFDFNG